MTIQSWAEAMVSTMQNDLTIANLLTGGIYNYPSTGRKGINPTVLPAAWTKQGLLLPIAVVLQTDENSDNQVVGGTMSYVLPLYIWLYNDANAGYATINSARDYIRKLLHQARYPTVPNSFQSLYVDALLDKREPDLQDACYNRMNFKCYGLNRPS